MVQEALRAQNTTIYSNLTNGQVEASILIVPGIEAVERDLLETYEGRYHDARRQFCVENGGRAPETGADYGVINDYAEERRLYWLEQQQLKSRVRESKETVIVVLPDSREGVAMTDAQIQDEAIGGRLAWLNQQLTAVKHEDKGKRFGGSPAEFKTHLRARGMIVEAAEPESVRPDDTSGDIQPEESQNGVVHSHSWPITPEQFWELISLTACEESGREYVPYITPPPKSNLKRKLSIAAVAGTFIGIGIVGIRVNTPQYPETSQQSHGPISTQTTLQDQAVPVAYLANRREEYGIQGIVP